MPPSFRKIDYSLRPAKHAERRMLCELFRKLHPFQPVERYLYVGMGSLWFSDFTLFHRLLGIKEMISIDKSGAKDRLEANLPFGCIKLHLQSTNAALPKLDWKRKQFLWLDYDDPIEVSMLLDAKTVATRASSGTVLAVSMQSESAKEVEEVKGDEGVTAIERFRDRFGRERVPPEIWGDDLVSWNFAKLSRALIAGEIEAALATRNAGEAPADAMKFEPICDFEYSDGAKMTTTVGIFVAQRDANLFQACEFGSLDFLDHNGRLVHIEMPKLTVREIRRLEQQLPSIGGASLVGVPLKDVKQFAALYRYLPNFAVLES